MLLAHSLHGLQVIEQLSTRTIYIVIFLTIQHEAYEVVGLKTVVQLNNEGMIQHRTYRFLVLDDVFLLIVAYETL